MQIERIGEITSICHNTRMDDAMLNAVPPGRWGIGVSGGADSVALLMLMRARPNIQLHVIHLDHETRAGESTADAEFVASLASKFQIPFTLDKRSIIEQSIQNKSNNTSTRYRLARIALFARTVASENLQGVLLAHHADDQAETALMRILRGSSPQNLGGMRFESNVQGVKILRPLLNLPGSSLKDYLQKIGQTWREDSSNRSPDYQRNRLRPWLAEHREVVAPLLQLARASSNLRNWLERSAPNLAESFATSALSDLPEPLARHSSAKWLIDRGVSPALIDPHVCDRLILMAADSASPWKQNFPGDILIVRRKGKISVDS